MILYGNKQRRRSFGSALNGTIDFLNAYYIDISFILYVLYKCTSVDKKYLMLNKGIEDFD